MFFLIFKAHLSQPIIFAVCGAITCAGALVCVYRQRSREMFKPTEYKGKDPDGFFANSNRLRKTIHLVRTAYVGLPACVAGALFVDICLSLYNSAVQAPNLTRWQLLVKIGWALMASLALVTSARGIISFAENADYNNLLTIAKWVAAIAGIGLVGGGLFELFRFVPLPLIVLGTVMLLGVFTAVVMLTQAWNDNCRKKKRTPRYYGGISVYENEVQRHLWQERNRTEREEEIRLDVRERRLGRRRGLD